MKASKVLKILNISRQTLTKYVKNGDIRVFIKANKQYEYDNNDVYRKAGLSNERSNAIYTRVSTESQKKDLESQIKILVNYCNLNEEKVEKIYKDIDNNLCFYRKQFKLLLEDVLNYKISNIYITNKDRLSVILFNIIERFFLEYNCKIIVVNQEEEITENNEKEVFLEIINLLDCFDKKIYSKKRKRKLELIKEDLKNEFDL